MTCIIGFAHEGKVYIGGDSATAGGWTTRASLVHKVFHRKFSITRHNKGIPYLAESRFVIGYTTSWRMGQILEHHLSIEPQNDDESEMAYMVKVFAEGVRKCLKDFGFAEINSNKEVGGLFLVGYRGQVYHIDSDFQVGLMADGYDAVGCGQEYALGAFAALHDMPPVERILKALEIVAHFSNGVCAPFYVETLEDVQSKPE